MDGWAAPRAPQPARQMRRPHRWSCGPSSSVAKNGAAAASALNLAKRDGGCSDPRTPNSQLTGPPDRYEIRPLPHMGLTPRAKAGAGGNCLRLLLDVRNYGPREHVVLSRPKSQRTACVRPG